MTKEERDFIRLHREENANDLLLHSRGNPMIDMKVVACQVQGWQKARQKLPLWAEREDIIFPERLPMEQCSSQVTAEYKGKMAKRLIQQSDDASIKTRKVLLTDLTGGFGVDATMMARNVEGAMLTFVEKNTKLCRLADHNLPLLGVKNHKIKNDTCEQVLQTLPKQDIIYIDPARRDLNGNKTVRIEECTPNLADIHPTLLDKADIVMAKLSPMLDITDAIRKLSHLTEIHIASVDGECKEILLVLQSSLSSTQKTKTKIVCANINNNSTQLFTFYIGDEQSAVCRIASKVGKYLYEPNASVMKAGAFKTVGERFGLGKLHNSSHLYTSEGIVAEFPGRTFTVDQTFTMSKKDIKTLRQKTSQSNITTRNFPISVAEVRRKLKMKEGGDFFIFATTLADNSHTLILCHKA